MTIPKVSNMMSPATGTPVANQYIIKHNGNRYFQSYDSIIVETNSEVTYLDEYYWNYSRTTSKYRNIFLNETTKETQIKIDSGIYKLVNLN